MASNPQRARPELRLALAPRKAAALAALAAAVVLYGSLFPFQFRPLAAEGEAVAALLRSLEGRPGSRGDLIANVLLYAPFGFFSAACLSGSLRRPALLGLATFCGALLSFSVELAQSYIPGRIGSVWDVYANTAGSLLGALAFVVGAGRLSAVLDLRARRTAQPFAALVVLSWLGYRLYPYVPVVDLHKYWASLKPVVLTPTFEPFRTVRLAVLWLVAAHLIEAVAARGRAHLFVPAILVGTLGAGVFIADRVITLADVLGVGAALLGWWVLRPWARQGAILLTLLLAVVIADRLAPFDLGPAGRPFSWVPFRSVLSGQWGAGLQSTLEKLFLYGGLLWLLVQRGLPLPLAAAMEMGLLFATSLVQTRIPGRSAEITDTLLAAGAAIVFALLRRDRRRADGVASLGDGRTSPTSDDGKTLPDR